MVKIQELAQALQDHLVVIVCILDLVAVTAEGEDFSFQVQHHILAFGDHILGVEHGEILRAFVGHQLDWKHSPCWGTEFQLRQNGASLESFEPNLSHGT